MGFLLIRCFVKIQYGCLGLSGTFAIEHTPKPFHSQATVGHKRVVIFTESVLFSSPWWYIISDHTQTNRIQALIATSALVTVYRWREHIMLDKFHENGSLFTSLANEGKYYPSNHPKPPIWPQQFAFLVYEEISKLVNILVRWYITNNSIYIMNIL